MYLKSLYLSLIIACITCSSYAQITFDTIAFNKAYDLKDELRANKNHKRIFELFLPFKESLSNDQSIYGAKWNIIIGSAHRYRAEFKEAKECFSNALSRSENIDSQEARKLHVAAKLNMGIIHKNKNEWKESLNYFSQVIQSVEQDTSLGIAHLASAYNSTGNIQRLQWDLDKALNSFEKAMQIFKDDPQKYKAGYVLYNIGITWQLIGEYKKAIKYLDKAEIYCLQSLNANHRFFEQLYSTLGEIYSYCYNFDKSALYLNKARDIIQSKDPVDPYWLGFNASSLGLLQLRKDQPEKAILHFEESWREWRKLFDEDDPYFKHMYSYMSRAYKDLGEYDLAIQSLNKSIELARSESLDENLGIASRLAKLAEIYYLKGDPEEALRLQLQSLEVTFDKKINENFYRSITSTLPYYYTKAGNLDKAIEYIQEQEKYYPQISEDSLYFFPPQKAMTWKNMASSWQSIAELSDKLEHWEKASYYWSEYFRLSASIKQFINEEESESFYIQSNSASYEQALITYFNEYKISNSKDAIHKAFMAIEENQHSTLQREITASNIRMDDGVPDSLYLKEQFFLFQITDLSQQLESNPALNDSLFRIKNEWIKLNRQITKQYPQLLSAAFNKRNQTLESLQVELDSRHTLLEYFVGEEYIFVIKIEKENTELFQLELDPNFKNNITEFIESIRGNQKEKFVSHAFQLHNQLIEPLGQIKEKVTIVPHAEIGFIPFEILLEQKSDDASYNEMDYLIRNHTISYQYSSLIAAELHQRKYKSKGILAVAPSFDDPSANDIATRSNVQSLNSLHYNQNEVENIIDILGEGDVLKNNGATKDNFLSKYKDYNILHLATHAVVDQQDPENSFIAFTNKDNGIDKLELADIYDLDLRSNLVVTSVCDGGIGEIKKGDGIISLARGFIHAGAKSIVTSLWSVNDKSTSAIMTKFYENINDGMTKDAAIRSAKLTYLEYQHLDSQAAPYYWAAFVPYGNLEEIEISSSPNKLLLLGIVLLLFGLLFAKLKSQSSPST